MVHDVDVLLPIRRPNIPWLREALASVENQRNIRPRLVAVLHPYDLGLKDEISSLSIETSIIVAPEFGNISDALNVGLAECRSEFVARMDADDVCEPTRLSEQVKHMLANPAVAVTASSVTLIDQDGVPIGIRKAPEDDFALLRTMRWKCAIIHPSCLFRRTIIHELGNYSPEAGGAEDFELWLRVLAKYSISTQPKPLLRYRVHSNQISTRFAVPKSTAMAVRRARVQLAQSRKESVALAHTRHLVWGSRQWARALSRPTPRSRATLRQSEPPAM